MTNILEFIKLNIEINHNLILKNLNATIQEGDCITILGPNGEGKSTLLKAIMGYSNINLDGSLIYKQQKINDLLINERSQEGIFLVNQNPIEIEGITNFEFYKSILKAHKQKVDVVSLYRNINDRLNQLNLNKDILERFLNVDLSGGEKKKNEIIQMLLINPQLILIDELDSGLDVDALKIISEILIDLKKQHKTILFITHNRQLIELLKPNKTWLIYNHQIIKEGDYQFGLDVLNQGFNQILNQLNLKRKDTISLNTCNLKKVK